MDSSLDFLRSEILLTGRICDGMERLSHYFRPFQTYVMKKSEDEKSRFDQTTALLVLERESQYLSAEPSLAGLFIYQFECISRNRLGYDAGLTAIADDPQYSEEWSNWIRKTKRRLGTTDLADMIYYRSQFFVDQRFHIGQKRDHGHVGIDSFTRAGVRGPIRGRA